MRSEVTTSDLWKRDKSFTSFFGSAILWKALVSLISPPDVWVFWISWKLQAKLIQEENSKSELLAQVSSSKKEREQIEASTQSKEDTIKSRAESNLLKYRDDISRLEKEISQLRLKSDSSKIAALRRGIDGSYASKLTDFRDATNLKDSAISYISKIMTAAKLHNLTENGGVKRERECVMCLSEEMSVVFLPCAHQVVCTVCNELHEKQGMKDCPSCRGPILRRVCVRYAPRPWVILLFFLLN